MEEFNFHIQESLKELKHEAKETNKRLLRIEIEIATLKVKSGAWGLLGGLISVAMLAAWNLIKK